VLQKAPCVLRIATTDWTTGRVQEFAHYPHPRKPGAREEAMTPENLRDAVLASTAIPGVFRPVEVQTSMISPDGTTRRLFADGGLVMNSPLNPAIDAGATVIHLIGVDPEVGSLTLSPIDNTVEVLQRSLTTAVASHIESDMDRARLVNRIAGVVRHEHSDDFYRAVTIHRYNPSKDCLGGVAGLLDFSASHIQALMENGEKVAREHKCETAGCVRVEPKNA
jgi:predicted acylesterase/phospholipase RssA